MGPKKRVTAVVNSPKYKLLRSTPIKKTSKLVVSRKGTPSGSKTSSSTKASPAPSADCLHELRFYPCDTPWHPHPEPAKRKLCPPCWLAQSKVWGLTGPEIGTTAECDRLPCKSCKKKAMVLMFALGLLVKMAGIRGLR